jgi:phosphatidylglycerophosphate synthase
MPPMCPWAAKSYTSSLFAMIDAQLNTWLRRPLQRLARPLHAAGVQADHLSWFGFGCACLAFALLVNGQFSGALAAMLVNRLADGLDGALARLRQPTDRGAFLDIALDFLFYASVPLGFALHAPAIHALPAAVLLFSFVGTGSSFLAFAVLAAKRQMGSLAFPQKGMYYLGGLTEGAETLAVFVLMCLWPSAFPALAYGFAVLCLLTTAMRIAAGWRAFDPAIHPERATD